MKFFFLFVLSILSTSAIADLALKHQEICDSEEVKSLMGETGACKVVIATQPVKSRSGVCMGRFSSLMCTVKFAIIPEGAAMNLSCGGVSQDLLAEALSYKVAALVKKENGELAFVDEGNDHISLSNRMFKLRLIEEDGVIKHQELSLAFGLEPVLLTDTLCI